MIADGSFVRNRFEGGRKICGFVGMNLDVATGITFRAKLCIWRKGMYSGWEVGYQRQEKYAVFHVVISSVYVGTVLILCYYSMAGHFLHKKANNFVGGAFLLFRSVPLVLVDIDRSVVCAKVRRNVDWSSKPCS